MIGVAVVAPRAMARARLESLVAGQHGLKLVSSSSSLAWLEHHPEADVVVIDIGEQSPQPIFSALARDPGLPPIVVVAGNLAPSVPGRLLRVGLRAVLPREPSASELTATIEAVAVGLIVVHPSMVPLAASKPTGSRSSAHEPGLDPLTPRELEILAMLAEGTGNRAIGRRLGISTHTVKFHVAAILDKLSARSRTEAVAIGLRRGLVMI